MQEICVKNWLDLNDALFRDSFDKRLGRHRSPYAFRGISRQVPELQTSLMNLRQDCAQVEQHIIRNFKKYAHRDAVSRDSIWNWLALAQHHFVPTRLLDWSYSPYVALHFVTQKVEEYDQDGAVWCVNYVRAKEKLPELLKEALSFEGSDVFTVEQLSELAPTTAQLDDLAEEPFVVFLEPPSIDERIVNQSALFSLMSSPTSKLGDWLERNAELCYKIIIPADLKWEVRDKLDQANINERVLFSGLDGLSRWIRRYYSPRIP